MKRWLYHWDAKAAQSAEVSVVTGPKEIDARMTRLYEGRHSHNQKRTSYMMQGFRVTEISYPTFGGVYCLIEEAEEAVAEALFTGFELEL